MVKIEKIYPGAEAYFIRDGMRQQAFLHQLLTLEESYTLKIAKGTIMYSINEESVVTKDADLVLRAVAADPKPEAAVESVKKVIDNTSSETKQKPKIVYPTRKK